MSTRLTVVSEIFSEQGNEIDDDTGKEISENTVGTFSYFTFVEKPLELQLECDEDGDLILEKCGGGNERNVRMRRKSENDELRLKIEHSKRTNLDLVGLQIWRGALLLADYIMRFGREEFTGKNVLELGSGVGLTGIVASMFCRHTFFTDIKEGGILDVIRRNIKHNANFVKSSVDVDELNFFHKRWSDATLEAVAKTHIVLAADVIYDNDVTEAFVETLIKISEISALPEITIYIAVEKRYIFTISDLDVVAPCYEHFLHCFQNALVKYSLKWDTKGVNVRDIPKYFRYNRNDDLVLWKIAALRMS